MMSKNSYFDLSLIIDKVKKNIWLVALHSVILFFAMPVAITISTQGYMSRAIQNASIEQRLPSLIMGFFTANNKFIILVSMLASIVSAATVYFYVNSRKQMDFYHSLPVKREKLFITNYISGAIIYLIPYTLSVILSVIALTAMGCASYLAPIQIVSGYLFNILAYIVVYSIAILAMVLCGNLVVSLLGTAVFLAYGPLICVAYVETMAYFYKNYYRELIRAENLARNSSPLLDFMIIDQQYTFSPYRVIAYIILTIVLIGVSMYLYKKRPSEAAGHAMAFKVSRPLIKYPIVFLCTLVFGLFFMSIGNNSMSWMIFGFICGGVLSHFIIEIIYHFDFKAIFKNVRGLGVFAVLFAVFISVPAFDMTGYDKRLPERSQIKDVKVSIINFNQNSHFRDIDLPSDVSYLNRERNILDRLTLSEPENIDEILKIAQMGVANIPGDENKYDASIGVEFELKNGRKISRRYESLKSSEIEPMIISVFDTDEFKQKFYSIYSIDSKDVSQIAVLDMYARKGMDTSGQITDSTKISQLVDDIRADYSKLKGKPMKTEAPVMVLQLINGNPKERVIWEIRIPIYASFNRTIATLKLMGIEKPDMIPADMVDHILIDNYEYEKYVQSSYQGNMSLEYAKTRQSNEMQITDKDEIADILKVIVPESTVNYNPFFEREFGYRANVESSRYLNGYSESYIFKKNSVPEFVKEKFPK